MDAQALGRVFREAREAREITLAEAEHALRIRRRVLEGFEAGDFSIPAAPPVQLRGFLGNYARYLGLDADQVLEQFEQLHQAEQRRQRRERRRRGRPDARSAIPPTPRLDPGAGELLQQRRRRRRRLAGALYVLVLGTVALGVIVFVGLQFLEDRPQQSAPAGAVPQLIPPTSLPTALMRQEPAEAPGSGTTQRERRVVQNWNGSGVLVTTEAAQRTWLRVTADGEEEFVGMLRPGEHVEVAARLEVRLRAGNAEGLLITWNGQEQGVVGLRGQQVDMTFTQSGVTVDTGAVFEPTAVHTATAIATPAIDIAALLRTLTPEVVQGTGLAPTATPSGVDSLPAGAAAASVVPERATPTVALRASVTPLLPTIATASPTATAVLPPRATQTPAKPV